MKISMLFLGCILALSIAAYIFVDSNRILEFFTVRSQQAKCESAYQKCLEAGKDNTICTAYYNRCNLNVAAKYDSPGNYQALKTAFNSYWNYKPYRY